MQKACVSSDEILNIYVQVARTAFESNNESICRKMLGAAHTDAKLTSQKMSANILAELAELLLLTKEIRMAEEIYTLAIGSFKRSEPRFRWLAARVFDGLSEIYSLRSEHAKAIRTCQSTVSILEKTPAVDTDLLVSRLKKLARIHVLHGNDQKASELFERAINLGNKA